MLGYLDFVRTHLIRVSVRVYESSPLTDGLHLLTLNSHEHNQSMRAFLVRIGGGLLRVRLHEILFGKEWRSCERDAEDRIYNSSPG